MSNSHFNLLTMSAYRQNGTKKGYNPFDYPEEWEFFKHPFEEEDEDDILTNILFQIRKMTRRLHLYFDVDGRLETAFYFGLLDSLSETEDYLFGALKYARYCRLENLFFLTAHEDLGAFLEKLSRLKDELFSKISSFGGNTAELNQNCYEGNLFLRQYCELTQNGIPNDMLHALLRIPDFPSDLSKPLKLDKKANIWSYFNNATTELEFTEEEQNIEGAFDTSKLEEKLQPVDMLLWHIRGTLLWLVIKKIRWVCSNADALGHRHNKLVETMCKNAYDEVCDVYARSKAYAKRRDEEFLQQCGDYLYLQGRKPTIAEMHTYFNQQYRNLILTQNQSNQLYLRCRKQEGTFYVGFLNNLLKEETRQDAEDFLFCQTFGKELSTKQTTTDNVHKDGSSCGIENQQQQVRDKYQYHQIMKWAREECKDIVRHLLEQLEKFRVEGSIINGKIDKYEFNLKAYKKKQIFAVCKEIRGYLDIGKNEFGQYLLDNTNLGKDSNNPNNSITLSTILNQI